MNYPKILVVTEEPLRSNSFGFGRTLTNIFKDYPSDRVLFYVSVCDFSQEDHFTKFKVIERKLLILHCSHHRWYAIPLNRFFDSINHSIQFLRPNKTNIKKIIEFSPEIVLTVPMNYYTLLEGYLVSKSIGKPLVTYLMDDILQKKFIHVGSFFTDLVKLIFEKSVAWIMISKYLSNEIKSRYEISNKPVFILQNPIDLNLIIPEFIPIERKEFIIAYAGSIHDFHIDPIRNIAKAVFSLRKKGFDISFIIYTKKIFWNKFNTFFEEFKVINGGNIHYNLLFKTLNKADLLLCTSSFEKKHKRLISTSVFTKITDYLASARPIWCNGPNYAANNKFVIEKEIGFANNFQSKTELEYFIISRIENRTLEYETVKKQTECLINEYGEKNILINLDKFLSTINLKS